MKTSEEMTASLLRRRDAYYREKKRQSRIAACSAAGCLAVGIGVLSVIGAPEPARSTLDGSSEQGSGQVAQTETTTVIQGDICHHIITEQDYANGMESACYASPRDGECNYTIGLRRAMADYAYDPLTLFVVKITLYDSGVPLLSVKNLELYRTEAERLNHSGGAQWLEAVLYNAPIIPSDGEPVTATDGGLFLHGTMTADQIRALEGGAYGYFIWLSEYDPVAAE